MADEKKKGDIYLVAVEGHAPRLVRATDPRLARKHVLSGIYPPKIEVRRPTTDEAMDFALDGVAVEDAINEPAPEPAEPTGTIGGAQIVGDDDGEGQDLNDPVRTNPDDMLPLGDE